MRRAVAVFGTAVLLAGAGIWTEPGAGAAQQPLSTRQPEVDPKTVPANARRAYQEFWTTLPSEKRAALARELDRLEKLARSGTPVEADLSKLRDQYPDLSRLSASLASVRWITADPAGGQPYVCTGMLIVARNGRTRCIGALKRVT